jgi:hypothetical protein
MLYRSLPALPFTAVVIPPEAARPERKGPTA